MGNNEENVNVGEQKNLLDKNKSAFRKYKEMFLGGCSIWYLIKYELIVTLFSSLPGALGLVMRKIFYPSLFKKTGRGVVFGRNMTIRHPRKITIGDNVVFDDLSVIDAKGKGNQGITIGDNVVIGRNSVLSCKGGSISIGDFSNIGSNNSLLSESILQIGKYVFTAGHVYMVAGGNHSFARRDIPIWEQPSESKGGIVIEDDVWIGASCTIVDGVKIKKGAILGAASLAHKKIPSYSIALGNPASVIKKR
jgi:acetyltransferase-like isoleucine patch superfamily enzyme